MSTTEMCYPIDGDRGSRSLCRFWLSSVVIIALCQDAGFFKLPSLESRHAEESHFAMLLNQVAGCVTSGPRLKLRTHQSCGGIDRKRRVSLDRRPGWCWGPTNFGSRKAKCFYEGCKIITRLVEARARSRKPKSGRPLIFTH